MPDISEFNTNNLNHLADFLENSVKKKKFDMEEVCLNKHDGIPIAGMEVSSFTYEEYSRCGTVACALGHAPLAGIVPLPLETWGEYSTRVFGFGIFSNEFTWMFGTQWNKIDNTPKGAAARIRVYLTQGLPENWEDQTLDHAPLSYKKKKKLKI